MRVPNKGDLVIFATANIGAEGHAAELVHLTKSIDRVVSFDGDSQWKVVVGHYDWVHDGTENEVGYDFTIHIIERNDKWYFLRSEDRRS